MNQNILNVGKLLYEDYSFYIIFFIFLFNSSGYINKTFDTIFFFSQGTLYSVSILYYYMDNNIGWWNINKIITNRNNLISDSNLIIVNLLNSIIGYIFNKKILLTISENNGLIHNNENIFVILRDFFAIFYIYDFLFYINHRLLHTQLLYKKYHKLHHSIYANCSFSANYMTIIDYLLEVIIPYWLGLYLYNPCFMSSFIFAIIGQLNGAITHSGYKFKFFVNPKNHMEHHLYFKKNYGVGGPWDYLFKTNI